MASLLLKIKFLNGAFVSQNCIFSTVFIQIRYCPKNMWFFVNMGLILDFSSNNPGVIKCIPGVKLPKYTDTLRHSNIFARQLFTNFTN